MSICWLQAEAVPVLSVLDKQMPAQTKLRCLQFSIVNCDNLPDETYLSELDGSALLITLSPSRQCRTVLWFTMPGVTMKALQRLNSISEHQLKVIKAQREFQMMRMVPPVVRPH